MGVQRDLNPHEEKVKTVNSSEYFDITAKERDYELKILEENKSLTKKISQNIIPIEVRLQIEKDLKTGGKPEIWNAKE